jgi:4-hydroxy-tetrahydrodipicolinate synthase
MSSPRLEGIIPVVPTPFTAEEAIDLAAFRRLLDFAVAANACAVCLPAYASEFYKLSAAERERLIGEAAGYLGPRLPVIAQVNHPAAQEVMEGARRAAACGVAMVAIAVPRLFAVCESDLFRYFDRILCGIDLPVLIQDFNPGGPSVSAQFVAHLHRVHPHFQYIKLEEPMMAAKAEAILQATSGSVGVLEGWGGMYMIELIPVGVCGVVPGLSICDLLARIYNLLKAGDGDGASDLFEWVLPQIVYSLQNLELFHHAEKRLLQARGLLAEPTVRDLRLELITSQRDHIDHLNRRILHCLDRAGLPHDPTFSGGASCNSHVPLSSR